MQYGICHLSVVSVRNISNDTGEMTTQLLYGEHFKVLERQKKWSRIRIAFDKAEGWINNHQYLLISETDYENLNTSKSTKITTDLVSFITKEHDILIPLILGSFIPETPCLKHTHEGGCSFGQNDKENIVNTALLYLNAPFLWGGKTPFGIDSSGLTQMSYRTNGYKLSRNASEQAVQGEALSFIEESEAGDLAFFDNPDGIIDHVGIIMKNNYIIHSHGKVRIDRLDHTGIFNTELKNYTHKLRVIKKII
ncbi:C40 family peptidase [Costertonia aggregata]|uniref:C40 family peptidase n=1 Tax=Costertonia aggregata TaxID=343403 RepID=A0A7H9ATB2_9FLAO|nr:C40 family peptidase [Costertonia aggregata]QLG46647.1 C40 family peptidase [Costertonia aggregata]